MNPQTLKDIRGRDPNLRPRSRSASTARALELVKPGSRAARPRGNLRPETWARASAHGPGVEDARPKFKGADFGARRVSPRTRLHRGPASAGTTWERFLRAHPEYRPSIDVETTRRHPRSLVEAWPDVRPITNALGIDGSPEPIAPPPLWVRLLRPLVHLPERLSQ
jgi:hypothetical protein